MAIIGDLTDYAKTNYKTGGIRDYINGQYEHDGKDGEEVGIGGFTAFAQIRKNSSAAHPSRSHILKTEPTLMTTSSANQKP